MNIIPLYNKKTCTVLNILISKWTHIYEYLSLTRSSNLDVLSCLLINTSKFEGKIFPSHICPKLGSYWQKTCWGCRRNFKFGTQADFFMLRKKPQNNFFLRGQQHCENGIWNIKIFVSIFLLSHNILQGKFEAKLKK